MANPICSFAEQVHGADYGSNGSRLVTVRCATVHTTEGYGLGLINLGKTRRHSTPGTFNFLILEDGRIIQFYPANVRCSHAAGSNYTGPGIELEGKTGVPRPAAQLASLGRLVKWLAAEFNIPLVYEHGNPRVWADQTPTLKEFISHDHVDYPPNISYRHYDFIPDKEWLEAVGTAVTIRRIRSDMIILLAPNIYVANTWIAFLCVGSTILREFPGSPTGAFGIPQPAIDYAGDNIGIKVVTWDEINVLKKITALAQTVPTVGTSPTEPTVEVTRAALAAVAAEAATAKVLSGANAVGTAASTAVKNA